MLVSDLRHVENINGIIINPMKPANSCDAQALHTRPHVSSSWPRVISMSQSQNDEGDKVARPRSLGYGRGREDLNLAKSLLKEEVVTLGEDWEAWETKMEGNKCFALPLSPGRKSPVTEPPHTCVHVNGGDSRSLCSAVHLGRIVLESQASGWVSAREATQTQDRRAGRGGNEDDQSTFPPQPHPGLLCVCKAQGGLGSPRLGEGASATFCWTPGSSSTDTRLPHENLKVKDRCCVVWDT